MSLTKDGFFKQVDHKTGDDKYVLLGAGGHKLISDFATSGHDHDDKYLKLSGGTMTGAINLSNTNAKIAFGSLTTSPITGYKAPSLGSNGVGIYSRYGGSSDEGAIIITEDTCVIYNSADTGWNFQVMDKDLGTDMTLDVTRSFGVNQNHEAFSLGGFVKSGSSNSYVLLGGGGHKALSDFATSGHTHYWADVEVSSSADTETNPQVNNIKARVFTILHPTSASEERGTLTYKSGTYGWGDYLTTNLNGPMFCVTASNGVYMETSASTGLYVYGGSYYLQIRPESSTWASFYTNSIKYYFNKRIDVAGAIWQYDTNYGLASDGYFYAKGVYANRAGGSTYGGISLYSDSDPMTYGIAFRTTGTGTGEGGKLGRVQSDWATYFTMSDTAQRGWIFKSGSTNYASISARGEAYFSALGHDTYIVYPNGGTCTGNNDNTKGAIQIALPTTVFKSSTMMKMTVEIYNYSTGTSCTYVVGGYNYVDGDWYNVFAYSIRQGTSNYGNLRVRFGNNDSRNIIWIGEAVSDSNNNLTQTTWSYPQVYIKDVTLGHNNKNYNKWATGWSVSFVTSFSTVKTYVDNPAVNYNAETATKLGTSTVGGTVQPIYLNAGVPTALSDSAGGSATPVYLNAGTITKLTATRGGNKQPVWLNGGEIVASGGTEGSGTQFVYLSNGVITKTTSTVGDSSQPVYLNNGVITACSTMATSSHTHTLKLGGSNITVTTPSAVTSIIGPFAIDTSADSTKAFSIRRTGDSEAVKHWVDDSEYHIDYTNDEKSSSIHWRIINTDTESPSNPKQTTNFHVYLDSSGNFCPGTNETGSIGTSSYKWKYIYGKTIYGDLIGNVTGNASTATNADKLDGYHETSFFRYRGDISTNYVDLTTYTANATNYQNPNNGIWNVQRNGYSASLITFTGEGSTSGLDIYFDYTRGTDFKFRRRIDSNRLSGDWETIITSENINSQSVNYATSAGYASSAGYATYLTPQSYTPTNNTVAGHKAGLVSWMNNNKHYGIGDHVIVSASIISNWDNDSANYSDSSKYAMIKIGGGYSDSTYGQWLLSGYSTNRLGVIGRTGNNWNSIGIRWIAYTSDIPTVNNASLTLQTNGTTQTTFYANDNTAKTFNVTCANIGAATSGHNHDGRYVRSYDTTNDNIDSDWGQSIKTFDPIPSGTPPEQNPNITLLSLGNIWNRRKMFAFTYNNDNIYYRRHTDGGFSTWVQLIHSGNIGSQSVNYATSAGNADTVDGYHASSFALSGHTHNDLYVTAVGNGTGSYINQLYYTKNGSNNYFTVNYASTSEFLLTRSTAKESSGVQFIVGQIATATSPTNDKAYKGSSKDFKVLSFPNGGTAINNAGASNESANISIFRIAWGTSYWHDLHFSPNVNSIYHRTVQSTTANDWRILVETDGNKGNSTTPVYIEGGLVKECTPYANASVASAGNADMTDGLHVHTGRNNEANKIVRTDSNGYIQAGYINSSSGDENNNSNPNRVWGTNGSDSYLRTYKTSALSVGSATKVYVANNSNNTNFPVVFTEANSNNGYSFLYKRYSSILYNPSLDSFMLGEDSVASGAYSFAHGYKAKATNQYAHAEGNETTASGDSSHAEGYNTTSSGLLSHAEGNSTVSSGDTSHAEGYDTHASGSFAHAEGQSSTASGDDSHAEGYLCVASGKFAHAEGSATVASGYASHTSGEHTETTNSFEAAFGSWNASTQNSTVFSVGGGTAENDRSNLFEIQKNGTLLSKYGTILDTNNTSLTQSGNTITFTYGGRSTSLTVTGGSGSITHTQTTNTNNHYVLGVGNGSQPSNGSLSQVYSDNNFYFTHNGAYHASDARKKYDIKDVLNEDVNKLFETENGFIRHFKWINSNNDAYGFIAQELKEYCPEAVDFNEDDGFYAVNYNVAFSKIIGAMFKKIKELERKLQEKENH